jgi:CRP/FNR family transcriptional regulator, anaerobic regulatory protein
MILNALFQHISAIRQLDDELRDRLINDLEIIDVPKKTILLRDGEVSDYLYVVLSGLLRSYYIKDGHEICSRFMKENHIVVSINSFFVRKPGYEFLESMEDSTLARIHYDKLQKLYKDHDSFNYTARVLTEQYFAQGEQRLYLLRKQKAEERYLFFLDNYADFMNRVPLQYIATFLGMNLETLSRIRRKIKG